MPDTADISAKKTRTVRHGTRRRARLPQPSYADTLTGTNPPDDTLVQRCGRPHDRGLDIRDLCSPHSHPQHGSARHSQGPSDISASYLDSSDGHGHPTPLPCTAQTGVCPQSRPTFTPQRTVVRVTQGRTATVPVAVIPPRSLDAENAFSEGKQDPLYSSWASSPETPAGVQNKNASADLSNGIYAVLGQHEACPESDDNERTRPATTPSVRTFQSIHRHFVSLSIALNDYDPSLTCISDDAVLFGQPPSFFFQWTI